MKKRILLFCFVLLSQISFGQNDTINGDLYFGLWRYGSFYKQPKEVVKWVEDLSNLENRDSLDNQTKNILRIYEALQKEKLLYAPYIQLKLENDSIVRIYFKLKDYKKIRKHKLQALQKQHKKIQIELSSRYIDYGLYYCEELVRVKKIDGQTYAIPHKFAIEDYP